jgi:hypothetical protein
MNDIIRKRGTTRTIAVDITAPGAKPADSVTEHCVPVSLRQDAKPWLAASC